VIFRLAFRSLSTRPLRSAVLAVGFGLGIGVMVMLLGVGEVILEQAHAPALQGGGDLVVTGAVGPVDSARYLLSSVLGSDRFRSRTSAVSPSRKATLFLLAHDQKIAIGVRGGVPSREKAVGDPEVIGQDSWTDTPADAAWTGPTPGDVLRAMDRFHPVPASEPSDVVSGFRTSWAEWLYFNGKTADGTLRFYLTFITGAPDTSGVRPMFVRLQLNRAGRTTNYSAAAAVDGRELLEHAPDLDVAGNRVGQCSRALSEERFTSTAKRWPWMPPAITITIGDSGKAYAGSGDRWQAATSPSSTDACSHQRRSPMRRASPVFSESSDPTVRSRFRRTCRSQKTTQAARRRESRFRRTAARWSLRCSWTSPNRLALGCR